MKKSIMTIAGLLVAGTLWANSETTLVTFGAAAGTPKTAVSWVKDSVQGGYVVNTLSSEDFISSFSWGEMTETSQIMNQNENPLDAGTVIPYAATYPTSYSLEFTITAAKDIVISNLDFVFAGTYNGGSFTNPANANAKSENSTFKLLRLSNGSELSDLGTVTKTIVAYKKENLAQADTTNKVEFSPASSIVLSSGESATFKLSVTQNTINTGLKSISFTANSIPEPSLFGILAGMGALALASARRRRK